MPLRKAPVVTPDIRVTEEIERRFGLIAAGGPEGIGVSFEALGFGGVSIVENMEQDKKAWRDWDLDGSGFHPMFITRLSSQCHSRAAIDEKLESVTVHLVGRKVRTQKGFEAQIEYSMPD